MGGEMFMGVVLHRIQRRRNRGGGGGGGGGGYRFDIIT